MTLYTRARTLWHDKPQRDTPVLKDHLEKWDAAIKEVKDRCIVPSEKEWGADPTGVVNADALLQQCIIDANGEVPIFLDGTYMLNNPLLMHDRTKMFSLGRSGGLVIKSARDIVAIDGNNADSVRLESFFINCNGVGNVGATKGQGISGVFSGRSIFDDLGITNAIHSTIDATFGLLSTVKNCYLTADEWGTNLTASDFSFLDNYCYGGLRSFNWAGYPVTIRGNHFQTSGGVAQSYNMYVQPGNGLVICENRFENAKTACIRLEAASYYGDGETAATISDNFFKDAFGADGIVLAGFSPTATLSDITIQGNSFNQGFGWCVNLVNSKRVAIGGNQWAANYYPVHSQPTPCNFGAGCSGIELVGNNDNSFSGSGVNTNHGAASVLAGQAAVVVTHSLGAVPTRVQLTPTSDPQGRRWWVSAKTLTTFTITLDGNAVTNPITFDWTARV
jgi:hypothetical protein